MISPQSLTSTSLQHDCNNAKYVLNISYLHILYISDACSITDYDTDTVILTGGNPTWDRVEQYGHSGLLSRLPELNQGRYGHGCGSYMKDGKKVFQTFLIFSHYCWLKDISGGGGYW